MDLACTDPACVGDEMGLDGAGITCQGAAQVAQNSLNPERRQSGQQIDKVASVVESVN